jgi:glycine betaine/choline ABC-type transport system substrate-binding protein
MATKKSTGFDGKRGEGENTGHKYRLLADWRFYIVSIYVCVMLFLLLVELNFFPSIRAHRATNQVMLLVALLFLPFFFYLAPSVLERLKLRLPGGQEIDMEIKKMGFRFEEKHEKLSKATQELVGRVGLAEQALLPVIMGPNPDSGRRLDEGRLIIGSKEFYEQQILSHILAGTIRRSMPGDAVQVECITPDNGNSYKNFADLRYGWIDGYIEYTGTGMMLMMLLNNFFDTQLTVEKIVECLDEISRRRLGIAWLKPLKLHNEYTLVLDRRFKEKFDKKIEKISDLAAVSHDIDFCFTLEFRHRKDGLQRLKEKYGLQFRNEFDVDIDERYQMLEQGKAQLTSGFATDEEAQRADYIVLQDEDKVFPDYHAVPIFRVEALEKITGLGGCIDQLTGKISNPEMIEMIKEHERSGHSLSATRGIAEKFVDNLLNKKGGPSS